MRAYIESRDLLHPIDSDIQKAADGLQLLGAHVQYFRREEVYRLCTHLDNPTIVGTIDGMDTVFHEFDCRPDDIDFPTSIRAANLIYRPVHAMRLDTAIGVFKETGNGMFIKPQRTKLFSGIPITELGHLHYFNGFDNPRVWVSPLIDIKSEWRAYVHHGEIVQCSNYSGDFRIAPDYAYLDELVDSYDGGPIAYTIDVAVLADGSNDVIEFNDFWAIGSYGLEPVKYAEMLMDRYNEIVLQNKS